MAELAVQQITIAGAEEAALVAATATGDKFDNDGKTFLKVANGGGAPITVTIVGQKTLPLGTSASKAIAVTNGETWVIGPFPVGIFNTDGANEVEVTYSAVTTVTVGAFSVNDQYN
jgi:outer membrane receptor for ferrienterochelin and colicin